jgi:hypothetical protein
VKIDLQTGATFMTDAGLVAAGTGEVDFDASRRLAHGGLVGSAVTTLTSALGVSSGAAFRDTGTLIDRVYDRTGIRLLRILDLGALLRGADDGEWGVLNLLGLSNPLGSVGSNYLVWGEVAGWSNSYYLVWGTSVQDPDGEYLVWGTGDYGDEYLVWGTAIQPDSGK